MSTLLLSSMGGSSLQFWQSQHLHQGPHLSPALKHSQYFLTHLLLRQLHFFLYYSWIRSLKVPGLR
jgi:hypothetical protein